ncbi:MAG: NAD(+)/NADH kinase [bacterium]|nr:NAD(+)/NADH kinase [bacterium]
MRIALVPHIRQGHTVAWTRALVAALGDRGVEVVAAPDAADLIGVASTSFGGRDGLDLVVAIGGDGTVLKAVRLGRGSGAPVCGINDGRLGYLAEALPDDLPAFLDRMAAGAWLTSERMLLAASINGAPPTIGLNDVVVEKVENQRTVRLAISIDGEPFINYPADGVVVATATGSTAYNLSAGGPLIDPALEVMVMTPVAPHYLFSRAMVFPPHHRLRFEVMEDRPAGVGVDGREVAIMRPGDWIEVEGAGHVTFARFAERSFPASVKQKFSLA